MLHPSPTRVKKGNIPRPIRPLSTVWRVESSSAKSGREDSIRAWALQRSGLCPTHCFLLTGAAVQQAAAFFATR
jgi:hypothetical protein